MLKGIREMNIEIRNCNNINYGEFEVVEGRLNIKYAANGTGKSTIAKAFEAFINNDENKIKELVPFKYYNKANSPDSELKNIDTFNSIAVFNEKYIENYIFQPNELIKNSFEIFVKTSNYDDHIKQIESLLQSVNIAFQNHPELDELIDVFLKFVEGFGKAKNGYSAPGAIAKGIGKGNKIRNIPKGLEVYETYLKDKNNIKWLKWQIDGKAYLDMAEQCPYCTAKMEKTRREIILQVSDEYDTKSIEQLNKMLEVFELLYPYFVENTCQKIKEIAHNVADITETQKAFLLEVKDQIKNLSNQLLGLKQIGFHSLKNSEKIANELSKYKIDLSYYSHLNSSLAVEKVELINSTLDDVLSKAGLLQGEINKQKKHIKETIENNMNEINAFLFYAGYKYQVIIEYDEVKEYHLVLRHKDYDQNIDSVSNHLSYGEKNAFALVLFMYEVLKNNPDLVVLDDPISSFDGNKKFAIINMLFMGKKCLKDRTVLLLTHEFNTIIDAIKNMSHLFNPGPKAAFLSVKSGRLSEETINKDDIKSFVDIAKSSMDSEIDSLNKLVYFRRLEEIRGGNSLAYQIASNVLHKREKPLYKNPDTGELRDLTDEEIIKGEYDIKKEIPEFDYKKELEKANNLNLLKDLYYSSVSNYEKMQLYRIAFNENHENDVIKTFINETFHVENDYLFQLDPRKYDTVPQYIIEECDKSFESIL